jgi:hypothetical protein
MDQYAAEMIARGPTFALNGETPTGSVHILDLPDSLTPNGCARCTVGVGVGQHVGGPVPTVGGLEHDLGAATRTGFRSVPI